MNEVVVILLLAIFVINPEETTEVVNINLEIEVVNVIINKIVVIIISFNLKVISSWGDHEV